MAKRLQGKVAIITGGASGIGKATAMLFAKHGAKVTIADVQDDLGHAISKENPSNIAYVHCDVTNESDIKNAVDSVVSAHGCLDVMFSNAGITVPQFASFRDLEKSHFEKVYGVNVFGAFLGAKPAARVMIPDKRGSIIFTSSAVSVIGVESPIPYVSSKYAVVGLTNQLCLELGKHGIRVNCVSPFLIHTPLLGGAMGGAVDEKMAAEWVAASGNLKGGVLETEDVAEAAVFLGSDESKYVSGLNLVVDGGYSKVNPMLSMAVRGV